MILLLVLVYWIGCCLFCLRCLWVLCWLMVLLRGVLITCCFCFGLYALILVWLLVFRFVVWICQVCVIWFTGFDVMGVVNSVDIMRLLMVEFTRLLYCF